MNSKNPTKGFIRKHANVYMHSILQEIPILCEKKLSTRGLDKTALKCPVVVTADCREY